MAEDLQSTLASIPGLNGYIAMGQYLRQKQQQELADQQAAQFKADRAAIPSGSPASAYTGLALRYGGPQDVLKYGDDLQKLEDAKALRAETAGMLSKINQMGAPAAPSVQAPDTGLQTPPVTPSVPTSPTGNNARIAQLRAMSEIPQVANNPAALTSIQREIDRLQGGNWKAIGSGGLANLDNPSQNIAPMERPTQQGPLVSIVGPDGKPKLVTREEAVGKTPWVGSPDQIAVKMTGGRESVYVQRMMMGANQAAKDLANVVQLPLTASTGIFGGRKQGPGLFDATKEVLATKMTSQEAQAYTSMATGFQRSLAQIESAGLMPSGSLTHQMDSVLFKEGQSQLTKLHNLAQTRQIIEAGMEVVEANPRVSPSEKEKVKTILASVRKSVPFTHSDLIKLQLMQETNPNATLKDVNSTKSSVFDAADAILNGGR